MIVLDYLNLETFKIGSLELQPTKFPDGTSQVWHLPNEFFNSENHVKITWYFENERELMDVASVFYLLSVVKSRTLHLPYLPYGRQDKPFDNEKTFNLRVFGNIINDLGFDKVTTVDAHSELFNAYFNKSKNISILPTHQKVRSAVEPNIIVFPDAGAKSRYSDNFPMSLQMTGNKLRNQTTGEITGLSLTGTTPGYKSRVLIVDDICDGGATFEKVAEELRKLEPTVHITLFVTHGIFSKGKVLKGIDQVLTTNSLLKNSDSEYSV